MASAPRNSFCIPDELWFEELKPGYPVIKINNRHASATIALLGATLIEYTIAGEKPLIFTSPEAIFEEGKPIRGGIPVCWPWFGQHPTDPSMPNHGFVRDKFWELTSTSKHEEYTELSLQFDTRNVPAELWPHHTTAELKIKVGKNLELELITCNVSDSEITVGGALHTYFDIAAISDISVHGLDGVPYFDKVSETEGSQNGDITISQETDLVFHGTTGGVTIHDSGNGRDIRIHKKGSASTVVWNPWIDQSLRMKDLGDEDYLGFVCVETANALADVHTLESGGVHILGTTISSQANVS